jgi:hypothetical protein
VVPALLTGVLESSGAFGASGAKLFLEQVRRRAGEAGDPVERVLLEQLSICHIRVCQLHAQAAQTHSPESARLLNAAAARLLTEVRMIAVTLQSLRATRTGRPAAAPPAEGHDVPGTGPAGVRHRTGK